MATLDSTFRLLRKRAYLVSFAAFLSMAACVVALSFPDRANVEGSGEPRNGSTSSSWTKAGLEALKAVFEAVGATMLIYVVLELKIDDLVKGSKVLRKIDEIQNARGGELIIDALDRDIGAKTYIVSSVDFTIFINSATEVGGFDVTFSKIENVTVLYDSPSFTEDMKVEQYAGDKCSPWRLDTLKMDYGKGVVDDLSPKDREAKVVEYKIRDLRRGATYEQIVIRTRTFSSGIMENHVFLTTTNNVSITIDVDRSLSKLYGRYPLNIWVAPGVMGYLPSSEKKNSSGKAEPIKEEDNFKIISASTDRRLVYNYAPARQFLPYQGFSFFLNIGDSEGSTNPTQ